MHILPISIGCAPFASLMQCLPKPVGVDFEAWTSPGGRSQPPPGVKAEGASCTPCYRHFVWNLQELGYKMRLTNLNVLNQGKKEVKKMLTPKWRHAFRQHQRAQLSTRDLFFLIFRRIRLFQFFYVHWITWAEYRHSSPNPSFICSEENPCWRCRRNVATKEANSLLLQWNLPRRNR